MINRLLLLTLFLFLTYTACLGQTSFQGLTPGVSTRADVNRVLGQPVHAFPGMAEYAPPQGIKSITVDYYSDGLDSRGLVYEIRVLLLKPVSRSALIQKFNLPQQADGCKGKNDFGDLEECFGGEALLVFTYKSGDADSGVVKINYCGRGCFLLAQAICKKSLLPFQKDDLVHDVKEKIISTAQLTQNVERRGVNFQVTPAVEAELRSAGATPQLIEALRKNYRPTPGGTKQ